MQEAEEDFDRDDDELDGRGGERPFFASTQVFGNMGVGDLARRVDLLGLREPTGEGFERVPGGDLIIVRKPPFGGQVEDEAVDGVVHSSLGHGDAAVEG